MGTSNFSSGLAEMMYPQVKDIEIFATEKERQEWMSAASVVHTEEERAAVMDAAKDNVKYVMSLDGSSFTLSRTTDEQPLIMDLIEEGKPTPYTKGPGGEVQELDGSTSPSRSKVAGVSLPWYAWDAVPIEDDVNRVLQDVIPELMDDAAQSVMDKFGEKYVQPFVHNELMGGGSQ